MLSASNALWLVLCILVLADVYHTRKHNSTDIKCNIEYRCKHTLTLNLYLSKYKPYTVFEV